VKRSTILFCLFALFAAAGCKDSLEIAAIYESPNVSGAESKGVKLGRELTQSIDNLSASYDPDLGVIRVRFHPTAATLQLLRSAGSGELGPCLPDDTTYTGYVLRFYDRTGYLLGVSFPEEYPVLCRDRAHVFDPFERELVELPFPVNVPVHRDAVRAEFSIVLHRFFKGAEFRTDVGDYPRSWRSLSNRKDIEAE
jgi:hypothetical protein